MSDIGTNSASNVSSGSYSDVDERYFDLDRWIAGRSRQWSLFSKRVMDAFLALIGLLLVLPLLLITAALIWLTDPGPVLFWQDRVGRGGKRFRICKFRTMRSGQNDPAGRHPVLCDDPRVTRVGRILRRHSIDELPQLWNVLKGDMSLVGPRAHVPEMIVCGDRYDRVVASYALRHRIRPGITGLAQIRGFRGPVLDIEHAVGRVEADLEYIRSFSLFADLRILVRTVLIEFTRGSGV